MIPQCCTLWPIEDIGTNGYCYGWVLNTKLVCVAGVLKVGSLERAEAILDDFLKENPQFTEVSSTDAPVILGECAFASSSRTPHIQYLHEGGPASSSPFCGALVIYRRSALGSARFHAPVATTIAIADTTTTTITTPHAATAATPYYGHLGFETVGLDDQALTQVRFF